jgi:hypothetical protein
MKYAVGFHRAFFLALMGLATIGTPAARAADYLPGHYQSGYTPGPLALSCDNGRIYPLRVRAVSEAGEIVTGYLGTGHGRVHVRLIPMGNGYRYAGRGIWFDGKRDVAVLYFGQYRSVTCTVIPGGADAMVISAKG